VKIKFGASISRPPADRSQPHIHSEKVEIGLASE